jgi:hypothetical protein
MALKKGLSLTASGISSWFRRVRTRAVQRASISGPGRPECGVEDGDHGDVHRRLGFSSRLKSSRLPVSGDADATSGLRSASPR